MLQRNMPALLDGRAFDQGLGGGQLGHPAQIHTSRPGASTLCGRHPFAPNTPRRSPQGPAGSTRGMRWCFGPSRSSPTSRRDSGPSRTRRQALYAAPRIRRRHILLVRPLRSSFWTNTQLRENGRHARAAQRGSRKIGQRYENVRRLSCCTAFQRRSVTRLRRQQKQARLNRKAGPAPEE